MESKTSKNVTKSSIKSKEVSISQAPKDEINDKNALSGKNNKNKSEKMEENISKDKLPVSKDNNGDNELKIELFPENKPRGTLEKKKIKFLIQNAWGHSLDPNKELAFLSSKVPILYGFYTAYTNHYPIRIKPDDIWLLIVQAFSHHVDTNSEILREHFVNFDNRKTLTIVYEQELCKENVDKKILEDFSIQINEKAKKYLGEELLEKLTPNFTTTNYDSLIISKISIMGVFKKYFTYSMLRPICGIPYIILEGTEEDYLKIKYKAKKLRKFDFKWYIDRIIPHIEKMIDAKKGNIDVNYFKNFVQKTEVMGAKNFCRSPKQVKLDAINGWILDFFAYKEGYREKERFCDKSLKVQDIDKLAGQMLNVQFTIKDKIKKINYNMEYKVGFIGCDQNEQKEVFPVQGWIVTGKKDDDEDEDEDD